MGDDDRPAEMRGALGQIRREGYKAAIIYAVVDAAAVALLVSVLLQLVTVPLVPETVPVPEAVVELLDDAGLRLVEPAVSGAAVVALVAGLATAVLEVTLRVRRPLIEQFEAANPNVREALRTARDAVDSGVQNQIVLGLYEDVLADLRETSSVELLSLRRLAVTLLVVFALSLASIPLAGADVSLFEFDDGEPERVASPEYDGLNDPDEILGDRTNVSAGDNDLEARIGTSGDGSGESSEASGSYDASGVTARGDVQSQQAGFRPSERLEDAALIREYNLRIRDTDE